MIVEMAGKPPEHVKDTLEKHVGVLRKIKDIKVHDIVVSEPKEIEKVEGAFTCFAEVDFEIESFGRLCDTVFDFMPSSIEVIEPGKINLPCNEATSLLNIIAGRMHKYDEAARFANFKMNQMGQFLQKVQKGEIKIEKPEEKKEEIKEIVEEVKKEIKEEKKERRNEI